MLAPSLVYVLLNLYAELVVSTGIYPYVLVFASQHLATRGEVSGFLARAAIFGLESLASLITIASCLSLSIRSDYRFKVATVVLTIITLAFVLYPYLALTSGLPGFVVVNDGTNPNTGQSVALLPAQLLSVTGSASPYNLRFATITYATSTTSALAFLNPIGLDLELKDILALGSLPLIWIAANGPSEVRKALQQTVSRYPVLLTKGWDSIVRHL